MLNRPLTHLFAQGRPGGAAVAFSGPPGPGLRAHSRDAFGRAATAVADQARAQGGLRWLLAAEGAWACAVGMCGLLLAGRTVILPPNALPATLAELARGAAGVLRDLPETGGDPPGAAARLTGQLEFRTSGSTGEPQAHTRTMAQLDAELAALEAAFGERLGAALLAGTVGHRHIYGCLFRILWPLAAGRAFLAEPCGEPDALLAALALPLPVALVASPAHLARLPGLLDLAALAPPPVAVFSSGGPLAAGDALAWRSAVPAGVQEIYGSTETGGIAWRTQDGSPEAALWTPFPGVTVTFAGSGALVVASCGAGALPLTLADAGAAAADGRFRLLGRLDRTVKLEEKRISLPELETLLAAHPWVAQGAVLLLAGPRRVLGAAVVLSPGAPRQRSLLVPALRAHLAQRFEGVALPRRWRFVAGLPLDATGKLGAQALARLFETRP